MEHDFVIISCEDEMSHRPKIFYTDWKIEFQSRFIELSRVVSFLDPVTISRVIKI